MLTCNQCGKQNEPDAARCSQCGKLLGVPSTVWETRSLTELEKDHEARYGAVRFSADKQLILTVGDSQHKLVFDAVSFQKLVLGRTDTSSGYAPEIDLTRFDAQSLGVSRKHAIITQRARTLYLADLGSSNGTYLNGQRLAANQPRVLRDGDNIFLGNLLVGVSYG